MPQLIAEPVSIPRLHETPIRDLFVHLTASITHLSAKVREQLRNDLRADWPIAFCSESADPENPVYCRFNASMRDDGQEVIAEILVSRDGSSDRRLASQMGAKDSGSLDAVASRFSPLLGLVANAESVVDFESNIAILPRDGVISQLLGMSTNLGKARATLAGVQFAVARGSVEVRVAGSDELVASVTGVQVMELDSRVLLTIANEAQQLFQEVVFERA